MIPLTKLPEPEILKTNSKAWTKELLGEISKGNKPSEYLKSRYRHKEIKETLESETNNKCAYCESKIKHISHGDVEHIFPKSKNPKFTFKWDNLTLACEICNQNKGIIEDILDPYSDDPEDHIFFAGPILFSMPDSERGDLTIITLNLNRDPLMRQRIEKLESLDSEIKRTNSAKSPLLKKALIDCIKNKFLSCENEYSLMCNQFSKVKPIRAIIGHI